MTATKVAIATIAEKGLQDQVSQIFAKTETFTIVTIEDNKARDVKVLRNPAAKLSRGRGPVVVKLLAKEGVDVVIASEFGPGVLDLLEQRRIKKMKVKPKTPVIDVVRDFPSSFLKLYID